MAHVNIKHDKKKFPPKKKRKRKKNGMFFFGGGGDLLYLPCLISNTATVGTIFLASINSTPSAPPATDHLLQTSPIPTHLQRIKAKGGGGGGGEVRRAFGPPTHYRISNSASRRDLPTQGTKD